MNQSETIADLAAAVATANMSLENADKNAKNPHFNNRYADLAECLNTVRETYARNGLSVTQHCGSVLQPDGKIYAVVETQLQHSSGQWQRSVLMLPVVKPDPQGLGGALTYGRRYGLAAVTGIAQEDDDGNTASGNPSKAAPRAKEPTAPAPIEPARVGDLGPEAQAVAAAVRAAGTLEDLAAAVASVQDKVKDPAQVSALQVMFKERLGALRAAKGAK